jgi:murein L,D-transpeptidase YafK
MLAEDLGHMEESLAHYDLVYGKVPLNGDLRNKLTRGRIMLHEGNLAFQSSNYPLALNKLDSAEELITFVAAYANNALTSYFEDYPDWQQRAEQAVEYTKKHKTTCLVIDKYARVCMLYRNGVMVKSYPVELGSNWIGDKSYQGDKSTPEGSYRIIDKKSSGETNYYKALLLDYPNAEDRKRFQANQRNGNISEDASVGGNIEIHGKGGRGVDWTDGCIALSNSDMDHLYLNCSTGNEVVIVGSLRTLMEIMGENS